MDQTADLSLHSHGSFQVQDFNRYCLSITVARSGLFQQGRIHLFSLDAHLFENIQRWIFLISDIQYNAK